MNYFFGTLSAKQSLLTVRHFGDEHIMVPGNAMYVCRGGPVTLPVSVFRVLRLSRVFFI